MPSPTVTLPDASTINALFALAQALPLRAILLPLISMLLLEVRLELPLIVTVLEDWAVKELAVTAVLPLVVRLLPVSVMALLDLSVELPARVMALPVSRVTELAVIFIAPVLVSELDVI